ncbi:MAG: GTPase Era [Actinomycetota bacterium]|nr:GTPase Era [Actinomycetota bacterium]
MIPDQPSMRSGFVAMVGRPNVGKSSLVNAIVGQKVSITANKPQTTRFAIRGILSRPSSQIVFIDMPGLHKPKSELGRRLNSVIHDWVNDVDIVIAMFDASSDIGAGDRAVIEEVSAATSESNRPVAVINKADLVQPPVLLSRIDQIASMGQWADVLTTSVKRGTGLGDLCDRLESMLPEGPALYPLDTVTDLPELVAIAEMIREKAVGALTQELPYSVAVVVDEMEQRAGRELLDIFATIYVERDSQKGILIGAGGKMLKKIATQARKDIEESLGQHVYLDVVVKVEHEWQRDARALQRFGY